MLPLLVFPPLAPGVTPSKAGVPEPHMKFATQKMEKIVVSVRLFSAAVYGLLQVWFNHPLAWVYNSFRHPAAFLTVSQPYQDYSLSFRAANVAENISWDGHFIALSLQYFLWKSLLSQEQAFQITLSHLTAGDYFTYLASELKQTVSGQERQQSYPK